MNTHIDIHHSIQRAIYELVTSEIPLPGNRLGMTDLIFPHGHGGTMEGIHLIAAATVYSAIGGDMKAQRAMLDAVEAVIEDASAVREPL